MAANSSVIEASDSSFASDISANTPVLVDFWAEWCGPCRQIAPIVEELSNELSGKLKVVKVNIDENPETPQKYGVRGIPTLIVFKNGQPAATKVGSVPKSVLLEWVEKEIA
jgi:thioredoxin 1